MAHSKARFKSKCSSNMSILKKTFQLSGGSNKFEISIFSVYAYYTDVRIGELIEK